MTIPEPGTRVRLKPSAEPTFLARHHWNKWLIVCNNNDAAIGYGDLRMYNGSPVLVRPEDIEGSTWVGSKDIEIPNYLLCAECQAPVEDDYLCFKCRHGYDQSPFKTWVEEIKKNA